MCGISAALMCVLCPIAIPLNAVPITFATLIIYLIALICDVRTSLLSVMIYIILGCMGLPVFSGFNGGIGHILGPTGGFIIGYIPLTLCVSHFNRGKTTRIFGSIMGVISLYIIGCIGYSVYFNEAIITAFTLCVLPFIPGDIIKIVMSLMIYQKVKKIII